MSEILKYLIQKRKEEAFNNPENANDTEALGLIISYYFKWDGIAILKTLGYALEDANFHDENGIVQELISNLERPKEKTIHNRKEYVTVGTFKSKRSGQIYKVKRSFNSLYDQYELTCDCKGWIFNKKCKHIKYVEMNEGSVNLYYSHDNPIEL